MTSWRKDLRKHLAASTVACIFTVFSMLLDDAVDERLFPTSPAHRRRRRGRRRDHAPSPAERVWALPDHVLRIAEQARVLGGHSAGLLVITAAWTGCRWGELVGLQRDHLLLDAHRNHGELVIDPDIGALHESGHQLWLGPPKTPASARTITLPPLLVALLRTHLATLPGEFVFTSPPGYRLRRSTFDRRVFRPAVDGDLRKGTQPVRPGLTFHGLRHSHKTWLIADGIPEIAQARQLGHHLANRLVETYSHVAPEIEHRLLTTLATRPTPPQAHRQPAPLPPNAACTPHASCAAHHPAAPHNHRPATGHNDHAHTGTTNSGGKLPPEFLHLGALRRSSTRSVANHHANDDTLLPGNTPPQGDSIKKWS